MNLCLGAVYAWSIFKPAVEKVFAATAFQGNLPFMAFLACFAVMMFFGGTIMERIGPRWTALAGGLVVGLGWLLSSRATSIWELVLSYGVVAGSGVGLAVGLMLAGFGGSALVTGRIASLLIGDPKTLPVDELAVSLSRTFLWFGLAFTVLLAAPAGPVRAGIGYDCRRHESARAQHVRIAGGRDRLARRRCRWVAARDPLRRGQRG